MESRFCIKFILKNHFQTTCFRSTATTLDETTGRTFFWITFMGGRFRRLENLDDRVFLGRSSFWDPLMFYKLRGQTGKLSLHGSRKVSLKTRLSGIAVSSVLRSVRALPSFRIRFSLFPPPSANRTRTAARRFRARRIRSVYVEKHDHTAAYPWNDTTTCCYTIARVPSFFFLRKHRGRRRTSR